MEKSSDFIKAVAEIVGPGYAKIANDNLNSTENLFTNLLN